MESPVQNHIFVWDISEQEVIYNGYNKPDEMYCLRAHL